MASCSGRHTFRCETIGNASLPTVLVAPSMALARAVNPVGFPWFNRQKTTQTMSLRPAKCLTTGRKRPGQREMSCSSFRIVMMRWGEYEFAVSRETLRNAVRERLWAFVYSKRRVISDAVICLQCRHNGQTARPTVSRPSTPTPLRKPFWRCRLRRRKGLNDCLELGLGPMAAFSHQRYQTKSA